MVIRQMLNEISTNKQANIAITFALLVGAIVSISGASIDLAKILGARTRLQTFADGAVLTATSYDSIVALPNTPDNGLSLVNSYFKSQMGQFTDLVSYQMTPTVTVANGTLTATVSYSATFPSYFAGIVGIPSWTITGTSTAQAPTTTYLNIYLLLDDSPSMGIGASSSDIAAMTAANGCAFACHSPSGGFPGYSIPDVPGTQLRIDVLQSATQTLLSTAARTQSATTQISMAAYTYDNTVSTLAALTSNMTTLSSLVGQLALPTTAVVTQTGDAINWVTSRIGTSGNGSTQATAIKYLFLVTDGVEDVGYGYTPGQYDNFPQPNGYWYGADYTGTIMPSACSALKAQGVTIAVLYTQYAVVNDVRYVDLVQPFASNIPTALSSCASPGFFWQANTPSDITAAMAAMFAKATSGTPRLTN